MVLIFKSPVVKILTFLLLVVFVEYYQHHLKSRLASVASEATLQHLLQKHKCMSALNTICPNEETNHLKDATFMQHLFLFFNYETDTFLKH